jgi:hypothetical protein
MTRARWAVLLVGALCGAHVLPEGRLCAGALPPNDLNIPVDPWLQTVQRERFDRVLDRIEEVYRPIVAAQGGRLIVRRHWRSGQVNATATRLPGRWYLDMHGGLARHPSITEEGLMLVACHELGHHLGGGPRLFSLGPVRYWLAIEGAADYYGTLKCMRLVYGGAPPPGPADPAAEAACAAAFPDEPGRNDCRRGAIAGRSVAGMFQQLNGDAAPPRFDTPDASVARLTDRSHPPTQCRLDTYFQGALCAAPASAALSADDPSAGACTAANGHRVGLRPRCWYVPPRPLPSAGAVEEAVRAAASSLSGT